MRDGNSRTPDGPTEPGDTVTPLPDADAPPGDGGEVEVSMPADALPEPASVHVIVESDRTCIVLSGEVDADLAAELREATADAEATGLPIEIDAQHVTFMDSSGIAFLARIATRSTQRVRVIRAPETVRFLLDVTRIGELLDVVDDRSAAPDRTNGTSAETNVEGTSDPDEPPAHDLPTIGPSGRRRATAGPPPDDIA